MAKTTKPAGARRKATGRGKGTRPAYVKRLHPAVRAEFAAAVDLPTFLAAAGTLEPEDRKLLVRQAIVLIEQNYVHLPLKRAMHAIDPLQRLRLVLQELEQTPDADLPPEPTFHRDMTEIFTSTHDLHTNYILPAPFNGMFAFLPFMVEDYFKGGKRKYLVSNVVGLSHPTFVKGVELVSWNGIPIDQAVMNNARRFAGSNREAQHAHGVATLTGRALGITLPPDEGWVIVGYRTAAGVLAELRLDWAVNPPLPPVGAGDAVDDPAAAAAVGLDLEQHLMQRMRAALFAPSAVKAEKAAAGKPPAEPKATAGAAAGSIPSTMPTVFEARPVTTPAGTFGHLRVRTFYVEPAPFVAEFARLVAALPQAGLIIDVRGNPGGYIMNGEQILQLLTPRRIEPEPVQFINSPLNLRLCRSVPWLAEWAESVGQALQTGAVYSAGFPISDPTACNALGQKYFGPVVAIVDALCYSTTDFFAAGFQDHEIGPVLGADGNTGAGGANVWTHDFFRQLLPGAESPYQELPGGAEMRVAIRRGLRVGRRSGMPVEDLGVIPDVRHFMTRDDLLNDNVDLLATAGSLLAARQPARAFALALTAASATQLTATATTTGVTRLDVYQDGRPVRTLDVAGGQATFTVTKPAGATVTLEVQGFSGAELVARYRTTA